MGGGDDSEDDSDLHWTDDEDETNEATTSTGTMAPVPLQEMGQEVAACTSQSKLVSHFVGMGFSPDMVSKAIEENGEDDADAVLQTLLSSSGLIIKVYYMLPYPAFCKRLFPRLEPVT